MIILKITSVSRWRCVCLNLTVDLQAWCLISPPEAGGGGFYCYPLFSPDGGTL